MKKFIFIIGGARSGKSSYAVKLAKKHGKKVAFIATATSSDEEFKERIRLHKASRPKSWKVVEEGRNVSSVLPQISRRHDTILIDCLGLLVSNLLASNLKDKEIESRIRKLIGSICRINRTTIVVSNDVGSGIVPANTLARRFRDLVGLSNQMMAKEADEVIVIQAGIPVCVKGGQENAAVGRGQN